MTRPALVHALKIWPAAYEAALSGAKTFELRLNDRDYQVGDVLELNEWDPTAPPPPKSKLGQPFARGAYTNRSTRRRVSYVLTASDAAQFVRVPKPDDPGVFEHRPLPLHAAWVVLGLAPLEGLPVFELFEGAQLFGRPFRVQFFGPPDEDGFERDRARRWLGARLHYEHHALLKPREPRPVDVHVSPVEVSVTITFNAPEAARAWQERQAQLDARHPLEILEEFAEALGSPMDPAELLRLRDYLATLEADAPPAPPAPPASDG